MSSSAESSSNYWQPHVTADGSATFLSPDFGEHFHSLHGAWDEAIVKFVEPTQLVARARAQTLQERPRIRILDVCYGLGYNSAAALAVIWSIAPQCSVELVGLELDSSVAIAALPKITDQLRRIKGTIIPVGAVEHYSTAKFSTAAVERAIEVLSRLAQPIERQTTYDTVHFHGRLCWGDARQSIQAVADNRSASNAASSEKFDAIFLDPFSPPQCPQLWTIEFLDHLAQCLAPRGYLATYSCAAAIRAGLMRSGLSVGASPPFGRRWPGTVAAYPNDGTCAHLPKLSPQELEHLQTRAAVPYRDRHGTDHREIILERRRQEQSQCDLEPTSRWKRRWFGDCRASHKKASTP
ncbi:MAG: MnmC family methyltransferase [Cyanobacteria bacterium P01_C01_bin.89]